jgi:hypothetical protein
MILKRQASASREYLTFLAVSGTGNVEAAQADENMLVRQKLMVQRSDVPALTSTIA